MRVVDGRVTGAATVIGVATAKAEAVGIDFISWESVGQVEETVMEEGGGVGCWGPETTLTKAPRATFLLSTKGISWSSKLPLELPFTGISEIEAVTDMSTGGGVTGAEEMEVFEKGGKLTFGSRVGEQVSLSEAL
ncbi:hypothetical protein BGZ80_002865 [Entomortierella chlamydospora]|uniref:Uncharacterized protein n=1 Tax=Entomortierella chlamydospora TaxID=101097 RepID=A0A9P6MP93_9FUNG|nr:hypothetical protein BGZ80_002865 [Entomortierella chlamydospora]